MLDTCVDRAIEKYIERKDIDTNPSIVQIRYPLTKDMCSHWYYRSDQHIYQPDDFSLIGITPFVGHPLIAPEEVYGEGTFEIWPKMIRVAEKLSKFSKKN